MRRKRILLSFVTLLGLNVICQGEDEKSDLWDRETLTNGFWGLNDKLTDSGIEMSLGVTNIYQQNVRGGISTHRWAGRLSGSYDLELSADLEKLMGIERATFYMLTEGSYSDGIDGPSVGSFFGVNDDAGGDRSMDISELWYEQVFGDVPIHLRIGKLDLTAGFECRGRPAAFDGSTYANDETSQFLNGALVNNPTIPFPDNGLGVAVFYNRANFWYVSAAVADAQADVRETGFRTAFHGEDHFFYIFETGITPQLNSGNGPLQGAYRAGLWYDPQDKQRFSDSETRRDDTGFYLSFDQMLSKEKNLPEDSQGLGVFGRYGWASSKVNEVTNFWSLGLQYQGLFEGRDHDVLGVGFAQGFFSDMATPTYTDDYESVLEVYYKARVTPRLDISPSVQYVANPGGDKTINDSIILGLRVQMSF